MKLFKIAPNGKKIKQFFVCCRCYEEVSTDTDKVSDDYFAYCPSCDEDLYRFECKLADDQGEQ